MVLYHMVSYWYHIALWSWATLDEPPAILVDSGFGRQTWKECRPYAASYNFSGCDAFNIVQFKRFDGMLTICSLKFLSSALLHCRIPCLEGSFENHGQASFHRTSQNFIKAATGNTNAHWMAFIFFYLLSKAFQGATVRAYPWNQPRSWLI